MKKKKEKKLVLSLQRQLSFKKEAAKKWSKIVHAMRDVEYAFRENCGYCDLQHESGFENDYGTNNICQGCKLFKLEVCCASGTNRASRAIPYWKCESALNTLEEESKRIYDCIENDIAALLRKINFEKGLKA